MGGVFGIWSEDNCMERLWYSMFRAQHLGEKYCGFATSDGKEIRGKNRKGLVLVRFPHAEMPMLIKDYSGNCGISHVSLKERQPRILDDFAVAFTGSIHNAEDLKWEMKMGGHTFPKKHTEISVVSELIAHGKDIPEGIKYMASRIKGSQSTVVLNKDAVYAFRGKYGFKPLMYGQGKGFVAVSSTSRALEFIGIKREDIRNVLPGEIIRLSEGCIETVERLYGDNPELHVCSFGFSYGGDISEVVDEKSVKMARERMGAALARRDRQEGLEADVVMPIPDSGRGHAIGYHHEFGIPYDEGFVKDPYVTRTYIQPTQEEREFLADLKLTVIREVVEGNRLVVTDDSIVRGTTMKKRIHQLKNAGAKEVHVRIATPLLIDVCPYGVATKKKEELAYFQYGRGVEGIKEFLGADSLKYNTIEDYVEATGLPREKLCLFCCTGEPYEL